MDTKKENFVSFLLFAVLAMASILQVASYNVFNAYNQMIEDCQNEKQELEEFSLKQETEDEIYSYIAPYEEDIRSLTEPIKQELHQELKCVYWHLHRNIGKDRNIYAVALCVQYWALYCHHYLGFGKQETPTTEEETENNYSLVGAYLRIYSGSAPNHEIFIRFLINEFEEKIDLNTEMKTIYVGEYRNHIQNINNFIWEVLSDCVLPSMAPMDLFKDSERIKEAFNVISLESSSPENGGSKIIKVIKLLMRLDGDHSNPSASTSSSTTTVN